MFPTKGSRAPEKRKVCGRCRGVPVASLDYLGYFFNAFIPIWRKRGGGGLGELSCLGTTEFGHTDGLLRKWHRIIPSSFVRLDK